MKFPNLALMKLSGYYKRKKHSVTLLYDYENIEMYDKVYISKVFPDTEIPDGVLKMPNVIYGGPGFKKKGKLPDEIEYHMPDYTLYTEWVVEQYIKGCTLDDCAYFTDYSIGYLTRGGIRKKQGLTKVESSSLIEEFYNPYKEKICFMDDNIFAHDNWRKIMEEVAELRTPFRFIQPFDLRGLNDEKVRAMRSWRYDGAYNVFYGADDDLSVVDTKLRLIRKHFGNSSGRIRVLIECAYDKDCIYDDEFWERDILNVFNKVLFVNKYKMMPYVLRRREQQSDVYKRYYLIIEKWANVIENFAYKTLKEACWSGENSRYTKKIYKEMMKKMPYLRKYTEIAPPDRRLKIRKK